MALLQDIQLGLRMLAKRPGFSSVAILTLALGIGANTAIFSVVNAALLRPLRFPEPSRLVLLYEGVPSLGFPKFGFSAPDLMMYQQAQQSFVGVAAYQNKDFELSGAGAPERETCARISANLFSVLGTEPALGRAFRAEEDQPGHRVAMLSYAVWQSIFGGSADVVGRTVNLDRVPYTIVGVMGRDFQFPLPGAPMNSHSAALWVPMAFTPNELQGWGNMYNSSVVARLKPGVKLEQARLEANVLAKRIKQAYPAALLQQFGNPTLELQVASMQSELTGEVRPVVLLLQAAVGLVLLIACVNVGLLLLSRASGRSREIAIRTALGARRARVVAQLLSESFVLAIPGGVLGLGLALWSKTLLLNQRPPGVSLPHEIPLDATVLIFTLATTLLTAFLFGLVPALDATHVDVSSALQDGARGGTAGRRRHRIQGSFVVVEFALALVLMSGAGLLLRSFAKLLGTSPGFRPESVLAMSVPLPAQAYPHASDVRNYYQEAITRVARLPGVISVAASSDLPLNGIEIDVLQVEGHTESSGSNTPAVRQSWVLGNYLQTMGIPLIRGRWLTEEDRQGTQPVAMISASVARKFWPDGDPIGQRIHIGAVSAQWVTIVGVVGDVHDASLSTPPMLHTYTPYLQQSDASIEDTVMGQELRGLNLAVRTRGDPGTLGTAVLNQLHQLDPLLPVVDLRTMQSEIKESIAPQRFNATLVGIYAGLALLLALVGIYGMLAYMVAQQTRELGIRLALGAQRSDMLALVLLRGVRLAMIGIGIGLPAAWGASRLVASLLYGVSPRDPITFVSVPVILIAAALVACYLPALRATRVDPIVALRYE